MGPGLGAHSSKCCWGKAWGPARPGGPQLNPGADVYVPSAFAGLENRDGSRGSPAIACESGSLGDSTGPPVATAVVDWRTRSEGLLVDIHNASAVKQARREGRAKKKEMTQAFKEGEKVAGVQSRSGETAVARSVFQYS